MTFHINKLYTTYQLAYRHGQLDIHAHHCRLSNGVSHILHTSRVYGYCYISRFELDFFFRMVFTCAKIFLQSGIGDHIIILSTPATAASSTSTTDAMTAMIARENWFFHHNLSKLCYSPLSLMLFSIFIIIVSFLSVALYHRWIGA